MPICQGMNVKIVSGACYELFCMTLSRLLMGTSQTAPDGFVLRCIVVREEAGGPEVRLHASHGSQPRFEAVSYRLRCLVLMEQPPHHHCMTERVAGFTLTESGLRALLGEPSNPYRNHRGL